MKEYAQTNKKKIIAFIGILIGIGVLLITINNKHFDVEYEVNSNINLDSKNIITQEEEIKLILEENSNTIKFLANTFLIDDEVLKTKILENYESLNILNEDENFDKIVIEYLFNLENTEKDLFSFKKIANTMDKDYIVNVLNYFCNLYPDVDFSLAAGIAQVESGYTSLYMLSKNNIFGGMSKGRLISYKTIEYGVLKYVILLNDGYFSKGLTTVDAIGRVYNPMINEQGQKVAKPTWVNNVNNAMEEFLNYETIDTNMLIKLKNA